MTTETKQATLHGVTVTKKPSRHVVIALNHMHLRKEVLTAKIDELLAERADVEEAIAALE